MSAALTVSVVVVTWNGRQNLERCLRSLQRCTASVALEIIVVDNASSDGTAGMLAHAFPDTRLLVNTENLGFAHACNRGMASATGELVLLLNSDTYVEDDVIGRAAHHLIDRPQIGMLGCELRFPNGRRQHTANRRNGIRSSLVERLWLYRLLPRDRRSAWLLGGYWEEDRNIEVDWLAGAFMLLRRELFALSGGFDERFFMYGEDSEWCVRLRRMGHRILYAPSIEPSTTSERRAPTLSGASANASSGATAAAWSATRPCTDRAVRTCSGSPSCLARRSAGPCTGSRRGCAPAPTWRDRPSFTGGSRASTWPLRAADRGQRGKGNHV